MHLYDLLMLVLLVLLAWRGARRGFVIGVGGLVAFALAVALAARFDAVLGRRLRGVFPHLSASEARVVAFVAALVLAFLAVDLGVRLLGGVLHRVPLVGAADRIAGLLLGVALALLAIWLLTTALLVLPASTPGVGAGVRRSETARLMRGLPRTWERDLTRRLGHLGASPSPF